MISKRRVQLPIVFWISLLAFPSIPCSAANEGAELKARLMKEYPAALDRLADSYSHIRGSGTETEERRFGRNGPTASTAHFSFNVDGDNIKVTRNTDDGKYTVQSTNSKYGFRADAPKSDSPLALRALREGKENGVARSLDQFRRDFLTAPFSVRVPIKGFLWDPKLTTIDRVQRVNRDGRELVRVEYTRNYSFQHVPTKLNCWLVVAPDAGWALMEHNYSDEKGRHQLHTKIDYAPSPGGPPTPKRVTIESPAIAHIYDFDEFLFERTLEADFTLRSVGLPEINPRGNWLPRFLWLVPLGIAGLLLVIALLRKRKELQAST